MKKLTMKKMWLVSLLILACESNQKPSFDDVKKEAKEAVDVAAQYAKTRTVDPAEDQLKALDEKIDALKKELEKHNDAAKATLKKTLDELEAKRAELAKKLPSTKN